MAKIIGRRGRCGQAKFGPDVQWVDGPDDLVVSVAHEQAFYNEVRKYWPALGEGALQAGYAGIRPKRIGQQGERPALALQKYGVEYVEVRLFDLNPFVDIGITPEQSTFADVLLMMCLFRDSPPITSREQAENDENKRRIVNHGSHGGVEGWGTYKIEATCQT